VLQPLVVSALIDEIPVTKIRDGERASPSAFTHRSEMYDSSEPLSKSTQQVVCDPDAFLTNSSAVGNALCDMADGNRIIFGSAWDVPFIIS